MNTENDEVHEWQIVMPCTCESLIVIAGEVSETLSGVYKFELVWYVNICMEVHVP